MAEIDLQISVENLYALGANRKPMPDWVRHAIKEIASEIEVISAAPVADPERVEANAMLNAIAQYFQDIEHWWEDFEGGATEGTDLCNQIRRCINALLRQPMGLGANTLPAFKPQIDRG